MFKLPLNFRRESMRTIKLLIAAAIVTPLLAYAFVRVNAGSAPTQAEISAVEMSSNPQFQDALTNLTNDMHRYQQAQREQTQQTQQEQVRLTNVLAALAARLQSVEASVSERRVDAAVDSPLEQSTDTSNLNGHAGQALPENISEKELSRRLDETFRVGTGDAHLTAQATEQATISVGKTPGINLENMQCDQRFCRATFTNTNGREPDIQSLYGEPPFLTEGFTISEPDGRVLLYFTQPGVSLTALRTEALGE